MYILYFLHAFYIFTICYNILNIEIYFVLGNNALQKGKYGKGKYRTVLSPLVYK